ncbi:ABC transporter permease [Actinoallomurus iriomotensis]|jgi:ABC-2 type transport system permease protein|uniref:ABC transporter n=1 Tax=Actinoallomurus iriomotensis TaxID=478107 RepID=A0A9W6S653_9ACTN|nr:ABC transporter permease [Actinoallomurus iriomotensis]GLY86427.1 ABC transporter [Actinoallomurus iriomotensis]
MLRYLALEIRRMYRDRRFVFFTIALPVGFYLLWSNIFAKGDVDADTGLDAKTYLLVSMAAFGALGASLTTTGARLAAERQSGWLRQLRVTPLRPWAVIIAKVVASMCLALPAIVLVGVVAAVTQHVHLTVGEWAGMIGAMWLGTLPFAALGTLIGSLVGPDAAQPLTMACYLLLAILGGMWMSVSLLPKTLRHVAHWTPSNRFADLGWSIVAGHTPPASDVLVLAGWSVVLGALATVAYRRATVRS